VTERRGRAWSRHGEEKLRLVREGLVRRVVRGCGAYGEGWNDTGGGYHPPDLYHPLSLPVSNIGRKAE